jgi:hypothetical protein
MESLGIFWERILSVTKSKKITGGDQNDRFRFVSKDLLNVIVEVIVLIVDLKFFATFSARTDSIHDKK